MRNKTDKLRKSFIFLHFVFISRFGEVAFYVGILRVVREVICEYIATFWEKLLKFKELYAILFNMMK